VHGTSSAEPRNAIGIEKKIGEKHEDRSSEDMFWEIEVEGTD
jgi:hypothetical protein